MKAGVSVVVCCYNSANRLPETLRHLAIQQIPSRIQVEIIVVNNASTDKTTIVALNEWKKHRRNDIQFHIVDQPVPGLSHARDKGVEAAKHDYILFCDDDNWLCENYIQRAIDILISDERIAGVGGYGEAVSNTDLPAWFLQYAEEYAAAKRNWANGILPTGKLLIGAGLVFKKELYLITFSRLQSLLTDRKGNELSSCGDSEICLRFLLMGYKLYYDDQLVFKHYIPAERLTVEYRDKLLAGFGDAYPVLRAYRSIVTINGYSFFQRNIALLKSLIKIICSYFRLTKRWDNIQNLNQLYLLTGWDLGTVNPVYTKIRMAFVKNIDSMRRNKL